MANEAALTEGGGMTEYIQEQRKNMAPRNISPEVMGQHKAMVFNAIMTGGFTANPELAGWDSYPTEKKKLMISAFDSIDDVRYILNRENDNDVLAACLSKKKELEIVAHAAGIVPK